MTLQQHFEQLATYNQWMNAKLYDAAGTLSDSELTEERGAFFGSIFGTLNHIAVADTIWLKRFATHASSSERTLEVMGHYLRQLVLIRLSLMAWRVESASPMARYRDY